MWRGSRSLPDESWRSGSGEEQPLSGLLGLSLLGFLFGTVTYTHTYRCTRKHTQTRKEKQVKQRGHTHTHNSCNQTRTHTNTSQHPHKIKDSKMGINWIVYMHINATKRCDDARVPPPTHTHSYTNMRVGVGASMRWCARHAGTSVSHIRLLHSTMTHKQCPKLTESAKSWDIKIIQFKGIKLDYSSHSECII